MEKRDLFGKMKEEREAREEGGTETSGFEAHTKASHVLLLPTLECLTVPKYEMPKTAISLHDSLQFMMPCLHHLSTRVK